VRAVELDVPVPKPQVVLLIFALSLFLYAMFCYPIIVLKPGGQYKLRWSERNYPHIPVRDFDD
jgi:hypothetical protein